MLTTLITIGNGFNNRDALIEAKKRAARKAEILIDGCRTGREINQYVRSVSRVAGEWKVELVTELEVEPYEAPRSCYGDIIQKMVEE